MASLRKVAREAFSFFNGVCRGVRHGVRHGVIYFCHPERTCPLYGRVYTEFTYRIADRSFQDDKSRLHRSVHRRLHRDIHYRVPV